MCYSTGIHGTPPGCWGNAQTDPSGTRLGRILKGLQVVMSWCLSSSHTWSTYGSLEDTFLQGLRDPDPSSELFVSAEPSASLSTLLVPSPD